MPSLGADMEAGKLTAWKIRPGDSVKRGDIVAEVETEKAEIDVEIFATGIVNELLVQTGQKVPVGTVLATILEEGEAATPTPHERVRISPLAKTLAGELGVDVTAVHGTGPGGAITREDIERAAPRNLVHNQCRPRPSFKRECGAPSLPPWRDRIGRSRTITSKHKSTCIAGSNGFKRKT